MIFQPKLPLGYKAQYFDEVSSTNKIALDYSLDVCDYASFSPFWIVSAQQSSGRGTKGRIWVSDNKDNLYASLLFNPNCTDDKLSHIGLIAGIAVFDTIMALSEPSEKRDLLRIKWPNDLMVGQSKIAGILVETQKNKAIASPFAVIGIGLNIKVAPSLEEVEATCLAALGTKVRMVDVWEKLAFFIDVWMRRWYHGACFYDIANAWIKRAKIIESYILVETGSEMLRGQCLGCDNRGALLIASQKNEILKIDFNVIHSISQRDL